MMIKQVSNKKNIESVHTTSRAVFSRMILSILCNCWALFFIGLGLTKTRLCSLYRIHSHFLSFKSFFWLGFWLLRFFVILDVDLPHFDQIFHHSLKFLVNVCFFKVNSKSLKFFFIHTLNTEIIKVIVSLILWLERHFLQSLY